MKFTLSWLKEHLQTKANLGEISEKLTNIGLEVESVIDKSKELSSFTVAKVLEATKHPDADRLKVCKVQTHQGNFQVVCGAPNARSGMLGVFAPENSYIPGTKINLKKTKISFEDFFKSSCCTTKASLDRRLKKSSSVTIISRSAASVNSHLM